MKFVRSLIYFIYLYVSMAVIALAYVPVTLVRPLAGLGAARTWARSSVWALRVICGATVTIEGEENIPKEPALYASKHHAMLDTLTPFLSLPAPAIVLKRELLSMPLFGWFAVKTGMIPIDREAHASALRGMVRDARARASEGRDIVIFPEGTRQELGAPPDYKIGVAAIYRDINRPCVPIAVSTGLVWRAHGLIRTPGRAVIKYLPAIPPGLSRDAFMRELQNRIETETAALVARGR